MYEHGFVVMGRGPFPLDMLRTDKCFPSGDSGGLHQDFADTQTRNVRLIHYDISKTWEPTNDRWRSFGWGVRTGTHTVGKVPARL